MALNLFLVEKFRAHCVKPHRSLFFHTRHPVRPLLASAGHPDPGKHAARLYCESCLWPASTRSASAARRRHNKPTAALQDERLWVAFTHPSHYGTPGRFSAESAGESRAEWPVVRGCQTAAVSVSRAKQLKRRKNYCPVHSTLLSQNGE